MRHRIRKISRCYQPAVDVKFEGGQALIERPVWNLDNAAELRENAVVLCVDSKVRSGDRAGGLNYRVRPAAGAVGSGKRLCRLYPPRIKPGPRDDVAREGKQTAPGRAKDFRGVAPPGIGFAGPRSVPAAGPANRQRS